jgi:hypothetical protein
MFEEFVGRRNVALDTAGTISFDVHCSASLTALRRRPWSKLAPLAARASPFVIGRPQRLATSIRSN